MPDAIDVSSAMEGARPAPEDAGDWGRMAERVRRDHATMRALLDDVERASRAVEERGSGGFERLRRAAWTLYAAFDEHLASEEAYFAPILRTVDAWGELRVVNMMTAHNEQRRAILELIRSADSGVKGADALVAEARALVRSFQTDMDKEERSLDDAGLVPSVIPDQEDG